MPELNPVLFASLAFVAGMVLMGVIHSLRARGRRSDIEFLQFERDHREQIRDSKIHRDRVARRSIFSALFFLAVLLILTVIVVEMNERLMSLESGRILGFHWVYWLLSIGWTVLLNAVLFQWRRYKNVNSYQKFIYKIDEKIIKSRKKNK